MSMRSTRRKYAAGYGCLGKMETFKLNQFLPIGERKMTERTQEIKLFPMPKNEDELIECFKKIKQDQDIATVSSNYFLGQMIVAVYKKEYGKDKQQKLAAETGF